MNYASSITVRRPRIVFPKQIDRQFIAGKPELSYMLLGLSLHLPYGEPYMIKVMNKAKRFVKDPQLRQAISLFTAQEGQHYRLHKRFNQAVVGANSPAIAKLEAELAQECDELLATRSLKWNLAYMAGIEAVTVALARYLLEEQLVRDADPAVRDLIEWHAVEELEHRSVAMQIYEHLYGGYAYRVAVGAIAQRDLGRFTLRVMAALREQDIADGRDLGTTAEVVGRLASLASRSVKRLLPKVVEAFSPRYAPEKIRMPAGIDAVLQRLAGWDPVAELAASERAASERAASERAAALPLSA